MMLGSRILVVVALLSFFHYQVRAQQEDGELSIILQWTGLHTCDDGKCSLNSTIPYPSQYACYPNGGNWNNGKVSFYDPLPEGYFLTDVNITFVGRFFCSPNEPKTTFFALINDIFLFSDRFPETEPGCNCSECFIESPNYSTEGNDVDFSGYKYNDYNNFVITLVDNEICLAYLNLTFYYTRDPIRLESIHPSDGPSRGGTYVEIRGTNFPNDTVDWWCRFGNKTVGAFPKNDDTVACTTPQHEPGTTQVSISYGGDFIGGLEFTFNPESTQNILAEIWNKYWWAFLVGIMIFGTIAFMCIASYRKRKRMAAFRFSLDSQPLLGSGRSSYKLGGASAIDFREIQLAERIGRGNFGEVFKGYWRRKEIAVKKTKIPVNEEDAEDFIQSFELEAKIMSTLRHPNVLQFLGICTAGPNEVCIITEYMPRGSLYKILHDKGLEMTWELRLKIALDVSLGMNYLHNSDPMIIHRDLKSHNLLVDENFKVKVCDFGLAKLLDAQQTLGTMTSCGTPAWTAPEVLRNEKYTKKCDVFSFGIVLWELLTREDPHHGMPPFQVVFAVGTQGIRPALPSSSPGIFTDFIEECWNENPNNRPLFDEIIQRLEEMKAQNWDETL